jgi:hypothetical protein
MAGIRTQTSSADGQPLPYTWHMSSQKDSVIGLLQDNVPLCDMPPWWRKISYDDRCRIIRHLHAVGSLRASEGHVTVQGSLKPNSFREFSDALQSLTPTQIAGKRILGSEYTKLTACWRRGNGAVVHPADMNDGHLKNTLKLLNESHGNLVARCTELVGYVHSHFRNVTGIREYAQSLCIQLQKADVEQIYPIWRPLSDELQARIAKCEEARRRPPIMDTIEMFDSLMDAEIASW